MFIRCLVFSLGLILGAIITFVLSSGVVLALAGAAVLSSWDSFSLALGPITFFEFTGRTDTVLYSVKSGPGLTLLALLGGVALGFSALKVMQRFGPQRSQAV